MTTMTQSLLPHWVLVMHWRYQCKVRQSGFLPDHHTPEADNIDTFRDHSTLLTKTFSIFLSCSQSLRYERGENYCPGRRCPISFSHLHEQSRRGEAGAPAAWIERLFAIVARAREPDVPVHRQRRSVTKCKRGRKSECHAAIPRNKAKRSRSIQQWDPTGHDGVGHQWCRRCERCDSTSSGADRGSWKNLARGVVGGTWAKRRDFRRTNNGPRRGPSIISPMLVPTPGPSGEALGHKNRALT
jgi:hypothetical protein